MSCHVAKTADACVPGCTQLWPCMADPGSCPRPFSSSPAMGLVTAELEESLGLEISIGSEHARSLPVAHGL